MAARPPDAFLSCTRFDDRHDGGAISEFRRRLANAVRAVTGEPFEIFHDVAGIGLGEEWADKLDDMIDQAYFFVPILTPSYFRDQQCRNELERFLEREERAGRHDLILPIYYIACDVLENDERRETDGLAKAIHARQIWDWRRLRHHSFRNREVRLHLEQVAKDIARARRGAKPLRLFIPYSHKDGRFRDRLDLHLALLRRGGLIAEWHDRKLEPGDRKDEIDLHAASADIVLPLVSADFLASDYLWGQEMTKALERHERGEARVIPVILRYCLWQNTPLARLQAVPKDAKPATAWPDLDRAFADVVTAIESAIQSFRRTEIVQAYSPTRGGPLPLNEAKLILVGYGEVGKTSIVNRLVSNSFGPNTRKTQGIQITHWPLRLNNKETVRLHIWDFGGQEIMHSTHQFFLTERTLYLLVICGRQGHEERDVEYWLRIIDSFAQDCPILIVLNKIKQHPFTLNQRGLSLQFTNIREFIETDCEDATGIDKLHEAIRRETDRLQYLREPFPASWTAIKSYLSGMKENCITFERYRELCCKFGETDTEAQDSLAFVLHSLGIALNYRSVPRLRDTHVLNPLWVTTGIYSIINANSLSQKRGELQVCDLEQILDRAAYPPERHLFLLELMRKFELCLKFPEDEDRYLIPELLDREEPMEVEDFRLEDCLGFEYHYPVLPEGLLPRFIVRTHVLSVNQPRWRTGVILQFEGNRALVRAVPLENRVLIAVSGAPAARRRLLAVVRSDFEHIHRNYKFQPEEMIPVRGNDGLIVPYVELLVLERNGRSTITKVVGDGVVELDVKKLLDGVDIDENRSVAAMVKAGGGIRLFYSYAHEDGDLRDELETHLKIFERSKTIESWSDRKIAGGEEWRGSIDEKLTTADIILLLVSPDFMNSDYCYDVEMKTALQRQEKGEACVIPILIRDVAWKKAPFGKLQALPSGGKAVATWGPDKYARDTAWRNVAEGIESAISAFLEASSAQ